MVSLGSSGLMLLTAMKTLPKSTAQAQPLSTSPLILFSSSHPGIPAETFEQHIYCLKVRFEPICYTGQPNIAFKVSNISYMPATVRELKS